MSSKQIKQFFFIITTILISYTIRWQYKTSYIMIQIYKKNYLMIIIKKKMTCIPSRPKANRSCAALNIQTFPLALSPTFVNFRQLSNIYEYLPQLTPTFAKTPLLARSFSLCYLSVLPQFFVLKRKNEGRTEEKGTSRQRSNDCVAATVVPYAHVTTSLNLFI